MEEKLPSREFGAGGGRGGKESKVHDALAKVLTMASWECVWKGKIYNPLFAVKRTMASKVALIILKKGAETVQQCRLKEISQLASENTPEIIGKAHLTHLV